MVFTAKRLKEIVADIGFTDLADYASTVQKRHIKAHNDKLSENPEVRGCLRSVQSGFRIPGNFDYTTNKGKANVLQYTNALSMIKFCSAGVTNKEKVFMAYLPGKTSLIFFFHI